MPLVCGAVQTLLAWHLRTESSLSRSVIATVAKSRHFGLTPACLSIAVVNLYPRSFLRLILLGWILMALPLMLAITFASLSLTHLAERSEAAIQQASQTARIGWELEEYLVQMERALRQYEVLRDPALLEDYATARREWQQRSAAFSHIPLLIPLSDRVSEILAFEAAAYQRFTADRTSLRALHEALGDLKSRTFDLLDAASHLTDAERQIFRAEAQTLRNRLLIAQMLAVLLVGVMFWFGRRIVARLLSSVERAVIALGNNLLERQIRIKGPDDLRWLGKRLDWLRRRMLALEEERTRILRHISHELKTPLAALREGASLLSEGVAGPLSPQQERIAHIMQGNALRLQGLIDGLLRLQQAEHAREFIEPVALRLDELIQQILATHKLAARDKQLHITGTLAPLTVAGGHEEVTTIINNLISNAIKFSPDGGSVRVMLTRDDKLAVLDVIDEGPGVPEDDRKKVFEPFYRSPGTKSVAGVGLGLAIAREFATAHRGSLEILPTPVGGHFRATLPLPEMTA
jgi:two-component system sensor histidine kinase GlrK